MTHASALKSSDALMQKRQKSFQPSTQEVSMSDTSQPSKTSKNTKRIYTYLSPEAHRELKLFSVQKDIPIDRIIKEAVNLWLLDKGADFQISED